MNINDIIYIDVETTDLIDYRNAKMPHILQLAATSSDLSRFSSYVTPIDPNFAIATKASQKNNLTKEKFLSIPVAKRPTFDIVWPRFMEWVESKQRED